MDPHPQFGWILYFILGSVESILWQQSNLKQNSKGHIYLNIYLSSFSSCKHVLHCWFKFNKISIKSCKNDKLKPSRRVQYLENIYKDSNPYNDINRIRVTKQDIKNYSSSISLELKKSNPGSYKNMARLFCHKIEDMSTKYTK